MSERALRKRVKVVQDGIDSAKADIANLGAGGVDEAAIGVIVDGKMASLVNPVTAGLTITTPVGNVEVGTTVTSVVMPWTIANPTSAASAKIVDTTNANATVETLVVAASGTVTEAVSIKKDIVATQSYRLDVTDKLSRVISSTVKTINWYLATYHGNSASASLDAAGVKALATKTLRASEAGSYNIANLTGYKYFAYPKSFGLYTSIKDADSGFALDVQAPTEITITNDEGIEVIMYVIRTTNSFSGVLNVTIA